MALFPTRALDARRQRGATLIIALIVLVAMSLAGIATMRSVDTSAVLAGNIAFKESALNSADQGLQAGNAFLAANISTAALNLDNNVPGVSSGGYFSSAGTADRDWYASSEWANAAALNGGVPDAVTGNTVYYMVHRMCACANTAPNAACGGGANLCVSTPDASELTGEGLDMSLPNYFKKSPAIHYRITARAVGPRNSTTVVQAHVRIQ